MLKQKSLADYLTLLQNNPIAVGWADDAPDSAASLIREMSNEVLWGW
jgi:hypothetical protein